VSDYGGRGWEWGEGGRERGKGAKYSLHICAGLGALGVRFSPLAISRMRIWRDCGPDHVARFGTVDELGCVGAVAVGGEADRVNTAAHRSPDTTQRLNLRGA